MGIYQAGLEHLLTDRQTYIHIYISEVLQHTGIYQAGLEHLLTDRQTDIHIYISEILQHTGIYQAGLEHLTDKQTYIYTLVRYSNIRASTRQALNTS